MLVRHAVLDAEHVVLIRAFGLNEALCLRCLVSEETSGQDVESLSCALLSSVPNFAFFFSL